MPTDDAAAQTEPQTDANQAPERSESELVADRRAKRDRLRDEFQIDPYGRRLDGLLGLAAARDRYDEAADTDHREHGKDDGFVDPRPIVAVAGRVMQHRDMGRLIFVSIRDATGDIQLAVSKKTVSAEAFKIAKLADLGDIVVARGPLAKTNKGEISVWAADQAVEGEAADKPGFELATKSLAPPPGKWHGLQDAELRYRKRYIDLYANTDVMETFQQRARILRQIRDFLTHPPADLGAGFLEVETPMMQPIAGGAAARPFTTHHNALDIDLFLRIAPELYLKRLLVGGMPRVFEINRNFRNEGIDRSHNPEFTMLELYQAFGDYHTMMAITERMFHTVAVGVIGAETLPFGDHEVSYALPFRRAPYHDLFEEHNGFPADDHDKLVAKAKELHINPDGKDHDVLLNDVWEETVEAHLIQPTFVIDYPASLCPLTKQKAGKPEIAERFELFVAGMELANAYTELNDPDVQEANFRKQVAGLDDEEATFRNVDDDFLESLRVGMPPAGGLGVGIDRLVMLMTNRRSIRDVILFPLMRPVTEG